MEQVKSKAFFIAKDEKVYAPQDGITRQFVGYDNNIMMVKVMFKKGAIGYQHQHPHVQTTYVAAGKFEVTIGNEVKILSTGDGFYTEPNIIHGAVCLEDGILIDVFSPIREDFYASL
jgi:quercetin dioxygenase-like cupin family protein